MICKKTLPFILIFFLSDLWAVTSSGFGNEAQRREYIIKASFILKFPAFISWPSENHSLKLCIPSDDPYRNIWTNLEKNTANLTPFTFHNLKGYSDYEDCNILFISGQKSPVIDRFSKLAMGKPVLIIGDSPGNLNKGIGINFLVINNRVRFEINRKSLRAKNIKVSSDLLELAYRVLE